MDIVMTVPVRVEGPDSIPPMLDAVRARVSARAFENFIARGGVHGHDLDDWLDAERELIIKPLAAVHAEGEDVFIEMVLPEIDLKRLTVHTALRHIVVASDPDEDGLQLCQLIELPCEISLDGVDAEKLQNLLRITAAVALIPTEMSVRKSIPAINVS
jgi:hypothetical protein